MENNKTKVIFRKDRHNGEIIAFFPETYTYGDLMIYVHNGQHGESNMFYYWDTAKATPAEYKPLFDELTNLVGYDLRVMQRMTY